MNLIEEEEEEVAEENIGICNFSEYVSNKVGNCSMNCNHNSLLNVQTFHWQNSPPITQPLFAPIGHGLPHR